MGRELFPNSKLSAIGTEYITSLQDLNTLYDRLVTHVMFLRNNKSPLVNDYVFSPTMRPLFHDDQNSLMRIWFRRPIFMPYIYIANTPYLSMSQNMPSRAIKKHAGASSKEEKEKIDKFFREVKGKVVFKKKVKKTKANLKKAKLI